MIESGRRGERGLKLQCVVWLMFLLSLYTYFVFMSNALKTCYPSKHAIVTKITKIMCLFGGDKAVDGVCRKDKTPAQRHWHILWAVQFAEISRHILKQR